MDDADILVYEQVILWKMLLHCLTTRGTSDLKIQRHIIWLKLILDSNQKSTFNNKKGIYAFWK